MLEAKPRRAAKGDLEYHHPTTIKAVHQPQSRGGANAASAVKMEDKWAIGGPHKLQGPLSSGGDWLALGKQLQRMVSLRLQEAEASAREDELRYQPPRLPADQMDMFGREPLSDSLDLVICNHCSKPVLASRFCAHLGRCPRAPDLSFQPPGADVSTTRSKRKSATQPSKPAGPGKRARLEAEDYAANGHNDGDDDAPGGATTTTTKAAGRAKSTKAKNAAGTDGTSKRAKGRTAKAAESAAKDAKGAIEPEKLKIRISLKDKAGEKKPPPGGGTLPPSPSLSSSSATASPDGFGEKEKAKEKDKEKHDAKERLAAAKQGRSGSGAADARLEMQPLPLATRTYVRRNKLRVLALTFLAPPPPPLDSGRTTKSPSIGGTAQRGSSSGGTTPVSSSASASAPPPAAVAAAVAAAAGYAANSYALAAHHQLVAGAPSVAQQPTGAAAFMSSSASSSGPQAHAPLGPNAGAANGYNLNALMQSVGKKGAGTHSVTISPNALKMYQAKQKMALMMAQQQAAAAAAAAAAANTMHMDTK